MLSREISLQRKPKFDIGRHHFETNAQWPGRAQRLKMTSFRARDFALSSVFILDVMADRQPYRIEPELFLLMRIAKSENEVKLTIV